MWVPLVECNESRSPGADYFVKRHLDHILSVDPMIDTLILGCTHYPLLMDKIRQYTPEGITLVPQGEYVAASLKDYLRSRDGPLPVEEWTLFLFDDRVRREVHGGRLPFLEWSRGGDPGDFGLK